jgi:hypothetical protein
MLVPEEKASPVRRAEVTSVVGSSGIGVAKTGEGVAISRFGILNGDRRFEIVSNRRDRDSISEKDILG